MAASAGKKESVSFSLFMEVNNPEFEEDLTTMATLFWAEGVWMNRWGREQKDWRKQIFELQTWSQVLGSQWPRWHALASWRAGPDGP